MHEAIVWEGKPRGGIAINFRDILASFMLISFTLYFDSIIEMPDYFAPWLIFSIFHMLILYIIIGRFIYDIIVRNNTIYTITKRKIIIARMKNNIEFDLENLPKVEIEILQNGKGNIIFGQRKNPWNKWDIRNLYPSRLGDAEFYKIDDVEYVFELINNSALTTAST